MLVIVFASIKGKIQQILFCFPGYTVPGAKEKYIESIHSMLAENTALKAVKL